MKKAMIVSAAGALVAFAATAKPQFVLPEVIYAAPGITCDIYYANVFDSPTPEKWAFQTYAKCGTSYKDHWTFTPGGRGGQTYQIVMNAWSDDCDYPICATATVKVASIPKDAKTRPITLALFGDSITGCMYQDQIMRDMTNGPFKAYKAVGTRKATPTGALHDGYGGWSYNSYLKEYMMGKDEYNNVQDEAERAQLKAAGIPVAKIEAWQTDLRRSPLLTVKKGKVVFDAQPWLDRINGGKAPDFLIVQLGVNATWWTKGTRDEVEKTTWDTIYAKEDNEVTPFYKQIRAALPNTQILMCNTPLGSDQNGFATNYHSDWNYVQQRKNSFALNKLLERWVKQQNDPKLAFVGLAQAIHPFYGYPRANVKVCKYETAEMPICNNAVHPSLVGGKQIGDAAAAAVMYFVGAQQQ